MKTRITSDEILAAVKAGFWCGHHNHKWFIGRYAGTATQYFPEYGHDMTKSQARAAMVAQSKKAA